jgi:hypothetical protein
MFGECILKRFGINLFLREENREGERERKGNEERKKA